MSRFDNVKSTCGRSLVARKDPPPEGAASKACLRHTFETAPKLRMTRIMRAYLHYLRVDLVFGLVVAVKTVFGRSFEHIALIVESGAVAWAIP